MSKKKRTPLLRDQSGQGTIEYIMILLIAVLGAGFLGNQVLGVFDTGILKLGSALEKDLHTGRVAASAWRN